MLKADLRKFYLSQQCSLPPSERLENSQFIAENFFQTFSLKKIKVLHIFLSTERNNEILTQLIYGKIWQDFLHINIVVPRINSASDELESLEFSNQTQLSKNNWQINEPTGNNLINPQMIDLVVVPLLCFDERGFRVGYGKGYYDRFLKTCRTDCLKIGLSYFPAIKKISDTHKNDVRLDYCLTPFDFYKF